MPFKRKARAFIRDEQDKADGYDDQPWLMCCFNCAWSQGAGKLCFARKHPQTGQYRKVWPSSVCTKFENIRKEFR